MMALAMLRNASWVSSRTLQQVRRRQNQCSSAMARSCHQVVDELFFGGTIYCFRHQAHSLDQGLHRSFYRPVLATRPGHYKCATSGRSPPPLWRKRWQARHPQPPHLSRPTLPSKRSGSWQGRPNQPEKRMTATGLNEQTTNKTRAPISDGRCAARFGVRFTSCVGACQRSRISPQRRPGVLPAGGHDSSASAAMSSPHFTQVGSGVTPLPVVA